MNQEWIPQWKEEVGEGLIMLPGNTSTSKNLDVALDFSKCNTEFSEN